MGVRPDAAEFDLNEIHHILLCHDLGIVVQPRVNVRQLFRKDQHFLISQGLQTDDGESKSLCSPAKCPSASRERRAS